MDNLDVETMEQIQDHDQPSITGSEDEIVSIPDTEPDGTADCITSTVDPTNGETSTCDELTAPVQRDYSRRIPILNEPLIDSLNRPPQTKRGQII